MADIIENEEIDRDTVDTETLEQLFNKKYNLLTETAVSLKKSYINKIHGNNSLNIAVSLDDNSIEVYKLNNTSLTKVCRLSGHSKALTEVVFSPKEDNLVFSSGEDGLVKLWDIRTSGTCVQEYKDEEDDTLRPFECMDISCNGRVLCAGSQLVKDDAYLVFWDQRVTKPLGGYWNSHTDDITQVKFHKEKTEILASGSLDGLLNVFNIMEATEDDALTYSLNVEKSVERLSWLDEKTVACLTQCHDAQLWNVETGDLARTYSRDKICRSIKRSKDDDCYLVDVLTAADGSRALLAGSYGGGGAALRSLALAARRLQPATDFAGNTQVVRCCWCGGHKDIIVLAGEGGVISAWGREGAAGPPAPPCKLGQLRVNRHKPY